jgi:hypothetical protein
MTMGAGLVARWRRAKRARSSSRAMPASAARLATLHHLILIRAATNAGNVSIKEGSNSAITVFVSGTLGDLKPIYIPIHARSIQGS